MYFYERCSGASFPQCQLKKYNQSLLQSYGVSERHIKDPSFLSFLAGQAVFDGVEPIALAYSGHQFGYFSPLLGDGRALMCGTIQDEKGQRLGYSK